MCAGRDGSSSSAPSLHSHGIFPAVFPVVTRACLCRAEGWHCRAAAECAWHCFTSDPHQQLLTPPFICSLAPSTRPPGTWRTSGHPVPSVSSWRMDPTQPPTKKKASSFGTERVKSVVYLIIYFTSFQGRISLRLFFFFLFPSSLLPPEDQAIPGTALADGFGDGKHKGIAPRSCSGS